MKRRPKRTMGHHGRAGRILYAVAASFALFIIYYGWNYFSAPTETYSSHIREHQDHAEQYDLIVKKSGIKVQELERPSNSHKDEEETWQKQKVLQDHLDEERLLQEKAADSLHKDFFQKLERLVHLDLKGAPPLVSYLVQLFPVLKDLGATGLLIEYEDMFPYSGDLAVLAASNAYKPEDLKIIQDSARAYGLEIVPLVQTFGHMEFVLKHEVYWPLRESDYSPQAITPAKNESYTLIKKMVLQVLKAHPDVSRFHLGCDEVFELGQGKSQNLIMAQRLDKDQLFLNHVVKVAQSIKAEFPKVQLLIWDDMMRNMPEDVVNKYRLPQFVEPVVWNYLPNTVTRIPTRTWLTYGRLFGGVWVASAFKGATGVAQFFTNASYHLTNHQSWLEIIRELGARKKMVNFRGIMLTGWQRYDHFSVLCELLPVGIPSLAVCLQTVKSGGFHKDEMDKAKQVLQCRQDVELSFPQINGTNTVVTNDCNFPGSKIYYDIQQLWGVVTAFKQDKGAQERISGWLSALQLNRGVSSPGQMKILERKVAKLLEKLQTLKKLLQEHLLKIYDSITVEEWLETHMDSRIEQLNAIQKKARMFQDQKAWSIGSPLSERQMDQDESLKNIDHVLDIVADAKRKFKPNFSGTRTNIPGFANENSLDSKANALQIKSKENQQLEGSDKLLGHRFAHQSIINGRVAPRPEFGSMGNKERYEHESNNHDQKEGAPQQLLPGFPRQQQRFNSLAGRAQPMFQDQNFPKHAALQQSLKFPSDRQRNFQPEGQRAAAQNILPNESVNSRKSFRVGLPEQNFNQQELKKLPRMEYRNGADQRNRDGQWVRRNVDMQNNQGRDRHFLK